MGSLLWVCAGGAVGSGMRWVVAGWVQRAAGATFPWGTLSVNLIGSFLLGLVMHVGLTTDVLPPTARLALSTGVMGGFTTYSTFSYETLELVRTGALALAAANVALTVVACLLSSVLGLVAGRALVG
ncbi:MAG: putative fluoride ion transporter CrcB 2 [Myxococcales bacterium]